MNIVFIFCARRVLYSVHSTVYCVYNIQCAMYSNPHVLWNVCINMPFIHRNSYQTEKNIKQRFNLSLSLSPRGKNIFPAESVIFVVTNGVRRSPPYWYLFWRYSLESVAVSRGSVAVSPLPPARGAVAVGILERGPRAPHGKSKLPGLVWGERKGRGIRAGTAFDPARSLSLCLAAQLNLCKREGMWEKNEGKPSVWFVT